MTLKKNLCLVLTLLIVIVLAVSCDLSALGGQTGPVVARLEIDPSSVVADYFVGDEVDVTGIKATATYTTGEKKELTYTDLSIVSLPTTDAAGESSIVVSYGGRTATLAITVNENALSAITVSGLEDTYNYGEEIDFTTLTINLRYIDGSSVPISFSQAEAGGLTYSHVNTFLIGETEITFVYQGKTRTYTVEIIDPIQRIELDNENRYFEFKTGATPEEKRNRLQTLAVRAVRYSGEYDLITIEDGLMVNYANIDTTAPTTQRKTFTVTYRGFTTQIPYEVVNLPKYKQLLIDPQSTFKTLYLPGQTLSALDTLKFRAILYEGGASTDIIDFGESISVSGYDAVNLDASGFYDIIFTYTDTESNSISVRLTVEVCAIQSITVEGFDTLIAIGDSFDTTCESFYLVITYTNGESISFRYADRAEQPILASALNVTTNVNTEKADLYAVVIEYLSYKTRVEVRVSETVLPDTDGGENNTDKVPLA